MDSILHSLLTYVLLYKYTAIFLITFLGELALPIPSGSILVMSFFFATQGYLNYFWVGAVGFSGNVLADLLGFWLARIYGKKVLLRVGLGWLLKTNGGAVLEGKLAKYPISTIFISRFTTTITPLVNVMVGLAEISFVTFIVVDLVGQLAEIGWNFFLGAIFGDNWTYLTDVLGNFGIITAAFVILLIVLFIRHKRGAAAHAASTSAR